MFEEMEKMETQIRCRQYVSYRVTLVMQHNSLQSYILIVSVFWERKKIKRTRVVVLTLYLEKKEFDISNLLMMTAGVIPH